jgi:oxygen-independent coproporphyrinogen-3 oxidase
MADHRLALIANPVPAPPVALYVHVPFCVSVCPYCDFVVYAGAAARGGRSRVGAFVDALLAEVSLRADALDAAFGSARPALDSVYLGGGTPSLLAADAVSDLLALVRERFGTAAGAEITLEANPGADERGNLAGFARAGVNRVSFGAQSLQPDELRRLGRRHTAADVADAVATARAAGIENVNVDLLYDVPGQTMASWAASLGGVLELEPDHVSLYALILDDPETEGLTGPLGDHLPARSGARRWRAAAMGEQDEDRAAAQYLDAGERLRAAGYRGYEISNWARPCRESRHNLAYWQRRPYEAVGPGAHAFDGVTRRWNAARLDGYVSALTPAAGTPPRLPPGGAERLDPRQAAGEAIILGLRLDAGVPLAEAARPPLGDVLDWASGLDLVRIAPDQRVVLTDRGRLLSNELFARLV